MTELNEDTIKSNAEGPKKVVGDGVSVEQHSIDEQIKADRYLASKAATRSNGLGIKRNRAVPPGSV